MDCIPNLEEPLAEYKQVATYLKDKRDKHLLQ